MTDFCFVCILFHFIYGMFFVHRVYFILGFAFAFGFGHTIAFIWANDSFFFGCWKVSFLFSIQKVYIHQSEVVRGIFCSSCMESRVHKANNEG